ncbi:MAG: hypothetical protein EZS28_008037 [Streblomastix strix]|uniref:Uncharacterized protein n=1 Tax=Streblomastix strix TaxID=222440 RepID=A0A5J4WMY6_9EUKA|nr:MAG: hypothetical protein EZS28_008037 [Streblomastix strix]
MIHTIHHALSSCWLGRRPGVRTKFDKAICLISSHFIVVITLIFFVHRMILSDNYDQHLRSDFVRTYCQLAKYENFTVVLPFEEYPNGFCMHKFSVCVRPWRFENVDQLQSSQTAFHYQANIIELRFQI